MRKKEREREKERREHGKEKEKQKKTEGKRNERRSQKQPRGTSKTKWGKRKRIYRRNTTILFLPLLSLQKKSLNRAVSTHQSPHLFLSLHLSIYLSAYLIRSDLILLSLSL